MILFFAKILQKIFGFDIRTAQWLTIAGACLAGLFLFYFIFSQIQSCAFNRQIEKKKIEVNALTNEAQNINANLNQLNIANQIKQSEVNQLNGNRSTAVNETDKSLENANRIRNKNYNGTTAEDLERKSKEIYK